MPPARLYVGTSGFSYPEWRGSFYPPDLPADAWLHHYSRVFPSVELNTTFYRFPRAAHVAEWRRATPRGFRFSVKANRLITHTRRLREVDDLVRLQLERLADLGDRAGPLLFQLPPSLRRDLPLLQAFLHLLPPGRWAMEFRHASWHTDDVYALLADHRTALVIMESDDDAPIVQTVGPFAYLRLHRYRYEPAALRTWATHIADQLGGGRDVYAYFTHEEGTPGPAYAQQLRTLVEA